MGGSLERGGRGWQLGCHICVRGRGSCMSRHTTTAAWWSTCTHFFLISFSLFSVIHSAFPLFLFFPSHPQSILPFLPLLCVAATPKPLWKLKLGRESKSKQMRGAHHGSDRVLALTEAFHHIFVDVCTPALQNSHSELLLLHCMLLLYERSLA